MLNIKNKGISLNGACKLSWIIFFFLLTSCSYSDKNNIQITDEVLDVHINYAKSYITVQRYRYPGIPWPEKTDNTDIYITMLNGFIQKYVSAFNASNSTLNFSVDQNFTLVIGQVIYAGNWSNKNGKISFNGKLDKLGNNSIPKTSGCNDSQTIEGEKIKEDLVIISFKENHECDSTSKEGSSLYKSSVSYKIRLKS
ncbi:hypothetical protein AM1_G0168 (plasmid) [Acaryochloris marina MBIC11017]|uniref:Lipoprotein n=2 Tax=Acaryochloris marina TaxID=155978 RepID=A8ZQR2_ACAM1|nr:hypothetical protein AM1_G0168 [Acaryochloris marina MBIC11017]